MSWAGEIDVAMRRGGSPYSSLDLVRWMREGTARLWVWPDMHASAVYLDGAVHVGHVFGTWSNDTMDEIVDRLHAFCVEHGETGVCVDGRRGWQRFLRQKGFSICR